MDVVISFVVFAYIVLLPIAIVTMLVMSKIRYGTWWPGPFL